ncbi:MAG: trypsin-like peptidase domain-containing protein, partial [Geitlerinemataceae cyanobacterium]
MRFLPFSTPRRPLATHLLALLLGAIVTFTMVRALPSLAAPITPETSLAQMPPSQLSTRSFVTSAVDRVGSAVVRIDTERTVSSNFEPFLDDPLLRQFFGNDLLQQMPREQLQRGQGSGFIIDDSGIVLTNAHVVNQADKVTVTLKDGRTLEGKVTGTDPVTDLAVVKIEGNDLPVAPLGDSSQIQVGDWAIAVGNP